MTEALHTKYRPKSFKTVVGQDTVVSVLMNVIGRKGSQAFLFYGPSGTGKTTLARISAKVMGCSEKDVLEIDAATYTGVDSMREIQTTLLYRPFGEGTMRAVIIDEAHSLSRQAWQSLLKVIEKPPAHVCWFLCTTEADKVPKTIKTRCSTFTLQPVEDDALAKLLKRVTDAEKIELSEDVQQLVIKEAWGSPRQLLVNLELCIGIESRKEAAKILQTVLASDVTYELCQFLLRGGSWQRAMGIISRLDGQSPEGVRIVLRNMFGSIIKKAKTDQEVCRLLGILDAFGTPYNQSEKETPLLHSIGQVLYSNQ